MPVFDQITRIVTFLRAESPTEDISKNPVVEHPHNTSRTVPERLPAAKIKELSALEPARSLQATAGEWVSIAAVIALCSAFWHPALYVIAVLFIGARQHALIILGHDASHYRYLPTRWQNELLGNLFLMWPSTERAMTSSLDPANYTVFRHHDIHRSVVWLRVNRR